MLTLTDIKKLWTSKIRVSMIKTFSFTGYYKAKQNRSDGVSARLYISKGIWVNFMMSKYKIAALMSTASTVALFWGGALILGLLHSVSHMGM